ncbi:hypothetical protein P7L78_26590 [Tistrella bauzanensis]|uniref:hypothetical protein n=1 Tax=Tistrella TaxID=171436 RepID=UPI0031F662C4
MLSHDIDNLVMHADWLARRGQMTDEAWATLVARLRAYAEDVSRLERLIVPGVAREAEVEAAPARPVNVIPFRRR